MHKTRSPNRQIREPKKIIRKIEETNVVCDVYYKDDDALDKDRVFRIFGFWNNKEKLENYLMRKCENFQKVVIKTIYHKVYWREMDILDFMVYSKEIEEIKND